MEGILAALLIFALRITDVSIGTVRLLYAMRGRKYIASGLGLIESGIFIFAISSALRDATGNPWKMVGYAAGFATGTFIGMSLEGWIASGTILARIVTRQRADELSTGLHGAGFGMTSLQGTGHQEDVQLIFVVTPRRRGKELVKLIAEIDSEAFVTIDRVNLARGGYFPELVTTGIFRK